MKVGDYVRTNLRDEIVIRKVIDIIHSTSMNDNRMKFDKPTKFSYYVEDNKDYKSSSNIIDLIEVGDYVNGARVTSFMFDGDKKIGVFVEATAWGYDANEIKSIVTKEQFESMEYKVGD